MKEELPEQVNVVAVH